MSCYLRFWKVSESIQIICVTKVNHSLNTYYLAEAVLETGTEWNKTCGSQAPKSSQENKHTSVHVHAHIQLDTLPMVEASVLPVSRTVNDITSAYLPA